jgi:hypothetical protein
MEDGLSGIPALFSQMMDLGAFPKQRKFITM